MSEFSGQPIDPSTIPLTADLAEIAERLARHNHDEWVRRQADQGWIYGAAFNNSKKTHPCFVPYTDLAEAEKQHAYNLASQTLQFIQACGFEILPHAVKPPTQAKHAAVNEKYEQLLARLKVAETGGEHDGPSALELPVLLQVWGERRDDAPEWELSPEIYRRIARRFLKIGAAPLAKEVAQAGLSVSAPFVGGQRTDDDLREPCWINDIELLEVLGLALARTGNPDEAQQILQKLKDDGHTNEETLGILARTYKDQAFLMPGGGDAGRELLRQSLVIYREAYEKWIGIWTGINVATIERLLGNRAESETVARRVQSQCSTLLEQSPSQTAVPDSTYWTLATLGEACLNLGDLEAAGKAYQQAHRAAPSNYGDLNSTRRHARWLLDYLIANGELPADSAALLDRWLPIPKVVVFSGHLLDRPGRSPPRFPAELANQVRETIRQWLLANHALIGYSSAACGSDLLFQQSIQDLGGESRIVLPYDAERFKADCVSFAGPAWSELFDRVLSRASQVIIASPKRSENDGLTYDYANLMLHGLATVRAAELELTERQPVGLAVWNGCPGDGNGGTESIVRRWQGLGMQVDQVDISAVPIDPAATFPVVKNPILSRGPSHSPEAPGDDTRIMAMLFGDAVNFSKLDEEQVRRFIQYFMSPIAEIVRSFHVANVVRNTWGDSLYLVFDHVREAGLCALKISKFVRGQIATGSWKKLHLPGDLNVRLALHAGPLFKCTDPITGHMNYTGTHVSRAARLEPKTPPGEVYASEAFAAICATYGVADFSLEYVRQLAWAKHYGTFPTFVLRQRTK